MARKKAPQRAVGRLRDAKGRFLNKRQIAARKGAETRRRAVVAQSFRHGKAAREKSEARLTPTQRRSRKRDAHRVERVELARKRSTAALKGWETRRRNQGKDQGVPIRRRLAPSQSLTGSKRRYRRAPDGSAGRPKLRPISTATKPSGTATTKSATTTPTRATTRTYSIPTTGSGDALKVQIAIEYELPEGMKPTNRLLYDAVLYRVENGHDHPRFTTRIIRWQNPGRGRGELRQWRQGNQGDAWTTLGPAVRAAMVRAGAGLH